MGSCNSSGVNDPVVKDPMSKPGAFVNFKEFMGVDCCTSNPNNYKVVAEMGYARLILMTLAPGEQDKPHDHPVHQMYVISGGRLRIGHPTEADGSGFKTDEVEMPSGAAPILPAGPHQVQNIGDTVVRIIFVEETAGYKGTPALPGFISPFDVYPEGYKKLAEDDNWMTGLMTMGSQKQDPPHSHNEHFVYCLEGNAITILPLPDITKPGAFAEKLEVPIKPDMAIPVPQGHHVVKNPGTECKLIFFERKN